MKLHKAVNLEERQAKTLKALSQAQRLTRAQLTVGPLRYLSARKRSQILQRLITEELIQEEVITGRPGPVTHQYVITEKGRSQAAAHC